MSQRTLALPLYLLIAILVFLLIPSPTFAQHAYIELTWGSGTFTYTTNNPNWSGTMYTIQSIIGTSIENPSWNNCSGDVLVMPVGALVTSRHFYISETGNLFVRRGLTISSQTTSITVQVRGTVQDHLLGDFWVGTDEVSNTSRFLFGNENCLTSNLTVPGSWFTTSHRVQVRIGFRWLLPIGSSGGVKRVRLTFNGWTVTSVEQVSSDIPLVHSLSQNYPNPFNPSTRIQFDLPRSEFVALTVYNMLGQEVARLVNEQMNPGRYEFTWDAIGMPSGTYFYRLRAGSFTETKKLVLLR